MKQERSKVQLFVQGSLFLVLSNICIKAINFFLLPLYTKNLTPSMLGVSDSITSFTGILYPLLVLGLDSAYSAFYFDKEDENRKKKVFSTLGIIFVLLGFMPVLMSVFSSSLSMLIFHTDEYRKEILVALFGVALNLWYLPFSLETRLRNRMGAFGAISILSSLCMVLLNILFVSVLKLGEMSLVLSTAIVAGENLILFAAVTKRIPEKKYYDSMLLRRMLVFAVPLIPSVLMAWILSLSDRYILLHYYGDSAVGLYGIGARFVTLLNVLVHAVSTAYTTFAYGSKDDKDAKEKYYYVFNVVSAFLLFISFSAAVFSKEIVMIMTDEVYYPSYVIVRDMMYGQTLYAMSSIVSYGIMFKKKSEYSLLAVSTGAILNLILNLIFIPKYGLSAAALTTLIGYLVSLIIAYILSEKLYPCNYGVTRIAITCVLTYGVSWITRDETIFIRLLVWAAAVIVCAVVYRDILKIIIGFAKVFLNHASRK